MERLGLVESISVTGSHLVGVSILLGAPAATIPVLSVQSVTTTELVKCFNSNVGVLTESRLSLKLSESESGLVLEC